MATFKPQMHPDPVRAFVESTLDEAGFAHLPEAERAGTVAALIVEARRRIGLELVKAMDPHSLEAFKELERRGADSDEVAAFLDVRVPDAEGVVRSALSDFGEECRHVAADITRKTPYDG